MMAEPEDHSQDLKVELIRPAGQRKAKDTIKVHRRVYGCFDDCLENSFQRTLPVTDNETACELPPSLGTFPLHRVSNYQKSLPTHISAKGGLCFPMYRKSRPSKLPQVSLGRAP